MATIEQLERALINADKAGDADAARKIAAFLKRARADVANQIPGTQVPGSMATPQEPGLGQQIVGAGEAALTAATGATGGTIGSIGGALKGLAEQILSGNFGTPQAANLVERASQEGSQVLTYQPRTQAGQEIVQDVIAPVGQALAPLAGLAPQMAGIARASEVLKPSAGAAGQVVGGNVRQAVTGVAQKAQQAIQTGREAVPFGKQSVGAAETPQAVQRRATAESLGLTGEAGLTKGQATRAFDEMQFEKEIAKNPELGAPIRQRAENQTSALLQKFDAMVDKAEPISLDRRDIGMSVDKAIVNKANIAKKQINKAYENARAAGELEQPVSMAPVAQRLSELDRFEGLAKNIAPVKKEAARLGIISQDENGALVGANTKLNDVELLRQFVNEATDWTDPREARIGKIMVRSIDDATDTAPGNLYQQARKLRRDYAREFENVGLTKKLLSTKRGTDERSIAFEDVFQKTILDSPVDEMNKLRRTLIGGGEEGKQAWKDLKAKGLEYIKTQSFNEGMSEGGKPLLSPAKLNRLVRKLDDEGKLESLYGKKQAQELRDIADIANVILTAPPGAINTSNTASALSVVLDSIGTATVTGMPIPAATALRELSKYAKNAKTKARIQQALRQNERQPQQVNQ